MYASAFTTNFYDDVKKHFQIQDSEGISSYAVFSDLLVNRQVQKYTKYRKI